MKKIIIVIFVIIVTLVTINEKSKIIIPKDAIRFRIIANSNSDIDQKEKLLIKNSVEKELFKIIRDAKNSSEARIIINNNLDKIDNIVKEYNVNYEINYGNNYFPEKVYKGITYESGEYESLVITLGKGLGNNWWCVLFPPLCLLDEENVNDYEYELYVSKLINNYK
jgi:stage II sporulation protein R